MLVGFWAIDEKPTGSKDPYALRRAALGVIRLLVDNRLRLPLDSVEWDAGGARGPKIEQPERLLDRLLTRYATQADIIFADADAPIECARRQRESASLLSFFADRLKVQLREQGARHDLVDAVLRLGDQDDLLMIVRRVEALGRFLDTDDGKNLLAGYRRAANILRDEEKKSGTTFDGVPELSAGAFRERALACDQRRDPGRGAGGEDGRFRERHGGARQAPPAGRRLLRQGAGQRPRPGGPRQPAEAPQPHPRGDARRGATSTRSPDRGGLFALAARGNPIWRRGLLSHRERAFALGVAGSAATETLRPKG